MVNNSKAGSTELDYIADLVGDFIEYWGFKRVQGRVWAYLFLSNRPMDAAELMDLLGVSKALISMTISTLLEYKVIEPAPAKGTHGARTYQACPHPSEAITNVLRVREKRLLAKIASAYRLASELPPKQKKETGLDSHRLKSFGLMVEGGEKILDQFIALGNLEMGFFKLIDDVE